MADSSDIAPFFGPLGPEELWTHRMRVQRTWAPGADRDRLLAVMRDWHELLTQHRRERAGEEGATRARTLELGRDGLELAEKIFLDRDRSFASILTQLAVMGIDYLGKSGYVEDTTQEVEGIVDIHRNRIHDHLWALAESYGRHKDPETAKAMDGFYATVFSDDVSLEDRIAMCMTLYRVACIAYVVRARAG